jgi:hypothetical protein
MKLCPRPEEACRRIELPRDWLDINTSKFYDWRERYGKVKEHNGRVP